MPSGFSCPAVCAEQWVCLMSRPAEWAEENFPVGTSPCAFVLFGTWPCGSLVGVRLRLPKHNSPGHGIPHLAEACVPSQLVSSRCSVVGVGRQREQLGGLVFRDAKMRISKVMHSVPTSELSILGGIAIRRAQSLISTPHSPRLGSSTAHSRSLTTRNPYHGDAVRLQVCITAPRHESEIIILQSTPDVRPLFA